MSRPGGRADDVHLYLAALPRAAELPALAGAPVCAALSAAELARAARLRCLAARAHFLAGRALARHGLSRHAAVPADSWQLAAAPTGELRVVAPHRHRHLRISISHCAGAVGCAVASTSRIGLDLEPDGRPLRSLERLIGRLSRPEQRALERLPLARRRRHFLRLWTLKEAFAKGLGFGLALPLSAACFALDDRLTADLSGAGEDAAAWRFISFLWAGRHWVSIAQAVPPTQRACWAHVHRLKFPLLEAGPAPDFVALC